MYKVINETHIQKMPEGPTILRGDNGQWKQGRVLQDDEVVLIHCCKNSVDNEELTVQDISLKDYLSTYKCPYCYLKAIPKPKPIETLFKEAMEKEAEEYFNKSPNFCRFILCGR